jgi:hypothetical protein
MRDAEQPTAGVLLRLGHPPIVGAKIRPERRNVRRELVLPHEPEIREHHRGVEAPPSRHVTPGPWRPKLLGQQLVAG